MSENNLNAPQEPKTTEKEANEKEKVEWNRLGIYLNKTENELFKKAVVGYQVKFPTMEEGKVAKALFMKSLKNYTDGQSELKEVREQLEKIIKLLKDNVNLSLENIIHTKATAKLNLDTTLELSKIVVEGLVDDENLKEKFISKIESPSKSYSTSDIINEYTLNNQKVDALFEELHHQEK